MSSREQRAFCFSAALHVVCLFAFGVVGLLTNCTEEREKVHVFQLVSAIPPTPKILEEPIPAPPKPPAIAIKKPAPEPPKIKALPTPSKPKVKPTPIPSKPKPKPKARPPKKPKVIPPKPKPVSYKVFRERHKLSPQKLPSKTKPRLSKPMVINPKDFAIPEIKISNPNLNPTPVDQNLMNRYLSKVKASLETTWQRMQAQANLTTGGQAKVEFSISATGAIFSIRIISSSGNRVLDELVLSTCRSAANMGTPPGGAIKSPLVIPFVVN